MEDSSPQNSVSRPGAGTWEAVEAWTLTVNVHNGHTHNTGDDDQGVTGRIVVHQKQPVCLPVGQWAAELGVPEAMDPFSLLSSPHPHPGNSGPAFPLVLTWLVRGIRRRKPATAPAKVTYIFLSRIHSVPTSSTMAVTSVSRRRNCRIRPSEQGPTLGPAASYPKPQARVPRLIPECPAPSR